MKNSTEWIPKYVIESLRREYQKNIFQMLQLSGEMESVCRLLRDHNIRTIFLKGPVLAADLYGDISLRTSSDLDIMIPIQDLGQTEELLSALGYVKTDYIETILGDWKWRHHHNTFYHPEKQIKLEIHWRLNPGPSKDPNFEQLWQRRRESTVTNYPVYYLGREDLFLFLTSHGARHGWSRLRWLADIAEILKQPIEWNKLKDLLRKYQYLHTAGQTLILVSELLRHPMDKQKLELMGKKRSKRLAKAAMFYISRVINLHTEPLPEEVSRFHKKYLYALMSFRRKIWFIMSFMYPYPEDADTLPLPNRLHLLYFPLRPFIWAWRKWRLYEKR